MADARRYVAEVIDGMWVGPNACSVCLKWFPPYKAAVPSDTADNYCWGHEPSIPDLIERSSLGTPGAKALRERTPPEVVDRIMQKVGELDRTIFICPVCEAVIEGDQPCPNGPHNGRSGADG